MPVAENMWHASGPVGSGGRIRVTRERESNFVLHSSGVVPMDDDFDTRVSQIEELLRHVAVIIKKRGRDILSDFGITNPQFNALLVLDTHPDITMGELCERLYLACSTATDLIDRMEKNGYLERRRDPEDRRVIRLRITPKARQVIDQVVQARRRYVKSILAKLDEKDIETLARSLHQLHSLMTEENPPAQ